MQPNEHCLTNSDFLRVQICNESFTHCKYSYFSRFNKSGGATLWEEGDCTYFLKR